MLCRRSACRSSGSRSESSRKTFLRSMCVGFLDREGVVDASYVSFERRRVSGDGWLMCEVVERVREGKVVVVGIRISLDLKTSVRQHN